MDALYLHANALLYAFLGAWCTLAPDRTSEAIGYRLASPSARSEYLVVYGGLEVGLAIFFFVAALTPALRPAGILFALATYGCLVVWRLGTVLTIPNLGRFPYAMLAIEGTMAALALFLWLKRAA